MEEYFNELYIKYKSMDYEEFLKETDYELKYGKYETRRNTLLHMLLNNFKKYINEVPMIDYNQLERSYIDIPKIGTELSISNDNLQEQYIDSYGSSRDLYVIGYSYDKYNQESLVVVKSKDNFNKYLNGDLYTINESFLVKLHGLNYITIRAGE